MGRKIRRPKVRRLTRDLPEVDVRKLAQSTARKELIWLKGKKQELDVLRVPIRHLYFNIENGRYADKMIQLRADNPGVEIDPRVDRWKDEIWRMLKGEYGGTEPDKEAFSRLRADIQARTQLRPGVVLSDGGVLDGNRRLAVLRDLYANEANPTQYEYFDAVILPQDVGEEDRWRIEAGLQIGRDEKLDYSPINRLLKIKQGVELFQASGKPADEIAKTLMGVPKVEVEWDIQKIRLIDDYLEFIGKPERYELVSRVIERFEEALNALGAAKKGRLSPQEVRDLKIKLFTTIRFETMDNWQMRDIWRALGVSGRGRAGRLRNEKAFKEFAKVDRPLAQVKKALEEKDKKFGEAEVANAERFLDQMQAAKEGEKPGRLVERARTNLEQLLNALEGGRRSRDWEKTVKPLTDNLKQVMVLAKRCWERLGTLRRKAEGSR